MTTFTVDSDADSPLANPTGTTCADSESTPRCSLRAAIDAANNLGTTVQIVVPADTYNLDAAANGTLNVHNPGGTSIGGAGASTTTIAISNGAGSVLTVDVDTNNRGGTLWLSGVTLTGGNASFGGGLLVRYPSDAAVLDGVTLSGNTASFGGGVACSDNTYAGASLWISNSTITSNNATTQGGGLYAYQCGVSLKSSHIDANGVGSTTSGSGVGGGIYASGGTVKIRGGSIDDNSAGLTGSYYGSGAGIYVSGAVIDGQNFSVDHNTAYESGFSSGDGGGISVSAQGIVSMTNASISSNTVQGTRSWGSALALEDGGQVALHNTDVDNNTTEYDGSDGSCFYGGAIYLYASTYAASVTIDQYSSVSHNNSTGIVSWVDGGSSKLNIGRSTVSDNHNANEANAAGGICSYVYDRGVSSVVLRRSTVSGNTAGGDASAGGVLNYAAERGTVALVVERGSVKNNVSNGFNGTGGIALMAITDSGSTAEINNATISGNSAPVAGYGGGVYMYNSGDNTGNGLHMTGTTVTGNSAGSADGGAGAGGGLAVYENASLEITGSTISNNSAFAGGGLDGQGGGVWNDSYAQASYTRTKITGNKATGPGASGGGVYSIGYGDRFLASTIANNSAVYGGGIYESYSTYTLDLERSTVSGNFAGDDTTDGSGGGIYMYQGSLFVTNSTLSGNLASGANGTGGAIYNANNYSGGAMTIDYSTIARNAAAVGAAYAAYSNLATGSVSGSIISGNNTTLTGSTPADCESASSPFTSAGHNVLTNANCVVALSFGDQLVTTARIAPLASNGGPTRTMRLKAGSAAINNGGSNCPDVDQRGVSRPATCDSGAYEKP